MIDARAEERRALAAATVAASLLILHQVAARAVRDALFLSAYRARSLPFVMIGAALAALVGAELLAVALARRSPSRAVPAASLLSALILLALSVTSLRAPRLTAVLLYLHVAAFGGPLVSGFWSFVNERFDPYTARRAVGRIGTGAAVGGVAGGVLAWVASGLMPVAALLPVLAVLHAAAAFVLMRSAGAARPASRPRVAIGFGLPSVLDNPYLRQLALLVFLGAGVEAILDFLFKAEAARRFEAGALLGVFALFHASVSVGSLLLQAAGARPALQRLGLAGTVALRPLFTGLGSVVGVAFPRLAAATFARAAHESLTNSLFRSGYELLYTPIPEAEKRRVKPVVDVASDKAGMVVGSALVLAALALRPGEAGRALFAVAALVSLLTLSLSRRLHRGYVATLERSLLAGRVRLDPGDVVDSTTQLTLAQTGMADRSRLLAQIEALRAGRTGTEAAPPAVPRSPQAPAEGAAVDEELLEALRRVRRGDPAAVRRLLTEHPDPPPLLVGALVPLLAADESFFDVLEALRRAAPRVTGQLVDTLLDPAADPVVRRRIPRVLKACPTARAAEGLLAALDDPSFEVRASASAALAALHERSAVVRLSRDAVIERVRRELDNGEPVDRQLPQLFALLSLAIERRPLEIAWGALRGGEQAPGDRGLRGTALEYLSNVLPEDVFGRLVSVFGASSYRPAAQKRPVEQVAEELRTSSAHLRREHLPWRDGGEV